MEESQVKVPSFFERMKRGFHLALDSIRFLFAHKKLLVFPLMMLCIALLCIGLYELYLYKVYGLHLNASSLFKFERITRGRGRGGSRLTMMGLVMWAAVYFIGLIIATFTNIGLAFATTQAFNGQKISLWLSVKKSFVRFKTVIAWVFYAFMIRILVGIFTGEGQREQKHWSLELMREMVTIAWTIINFLVAPVFALESWDALRSIHRSAYLMRKAFGEFIGATFSFSALVGLIVVISLVLVIGGFWLAIVFDKSLTPAIVMPYLMSIGAVVAGVLCSFVSAASTIFKTATYHYAVGNPIGFFTPQQIEQNFIENSVALPKDISLDEEDVNCAPSEQKGTLETLGNIITLTGITKFLKSVVKGLKLTLHCFRMFYHNSRLLLFPVLNGVVSALMLVLLVVGIIGLAAGAKNSAFAAYLMTALLIVMMIYVLPLISAMCNVGLTHATIDTFETGAFKTRKSLWVAIRLLPTLLAWALINSVVRFFAGSSTDQAFSVVGMPYSGLRGIWWMLSHVSWSILTFFLYPIIVQDRVGLFEGLKRSAELASEYFGQSVGVTISTGFIRKFAFDSFVFVGLAIFSVTMFVGKFVPKGTLGEVLDFSLIIVSFLLVLTIFFTILAIGSAINAIFHTVVYQYAHKRPTGIFDEQLLQDVLQNK